MKAISIEEKPVNQKQLCRAGPLFFNNAWWLSQKP